MYLHTTNYEDFRSIVQNFLGKTAIVFCGNKGERHQTEVVVVATDSTGSMFVIWESVTGYPESFQNEFANAVLLKEVGVLKWG